MAKLTETAGPSDLTIADIFKRNEQQLLGDWVGLQSQSAANPKTKVKPELIDTQSRQFLGVLVPALVPGQFDKLTGTEWGLVKETLTEISASRAKQGYSPTEIATFVFFAKTACL